MVGLGFVGFGLYESNELVGFQLREVGFTNGVQCHLGASKRNLGSLGGGLQFSELSFLRGELVARVIIFAISFVESQQVDILLRGGERDTGGVNFALFGVGGGGENAQQFGERNLAGLGGVLSFDERLGGGGIDGGGLSNLRVDDGKHLVGDRLGGGGIGEHLGCGGGFSLGGGFASFIGGGQCLVGSSFGGGSGLHTAGGGASFSLGGLLLFDNELGEGDLGIGNGFLAHGHGGVQCGHLHLGFSDAREHGLMHGGGVFGGGGFLLHHFLRGGKLISHRGGVQCEPRDLFAVGGVPYVNFTVPVGADDEFAIVAGDAGGGDVGGESEGALGAAAGVPQCGAAIAADGDKVAVLSTAQAKCTATVGSPALKLADFVDVPHFGGAVFAGADDNVGAGPFEAGDAAAMAHEACGTPTRFGFPHVNAAGAVARGDVFTFGAEAHCGDPIGVFFNFMEQLAGVG